MKKLLMFCLVLLIFCSCAKNYPQMVKDRVEQYKNEGKVIINCSDDETGKEHYIVYGDADSQTIGVDTLGEQVMVFNLGKKNVKTLTPSVKEDDGLSVKFEEQIFNDVPEQHDYRLSKDGNILQNGQSVEISTYKNMYIMLGKENPDFIFLNKNDAYYNLGGSGKIDEDGSLNVTLSYMFVNILPEEWADYTSEPEECPDLYIDRYHKDFLYKVVVSPQGNIIKKAETATCGGVQIPIEAFESWTTLRLYIQKIVYGL